MAAKLALSAPVDSMMALLLLDPVTDQVIGEVTGFPSKEVTVALIPMMLSVTGVLVATVKLADLTPVPRP